MTVSQINSSKEGSYSMEKLRLRSESGFTLIELLVVVAIIGILAAIAIPQFAAYRRRGFDAQVKSDLRNAASAQEAYFAENSAYKNGALTSGTPIGFNKTATVDTTSAATASGYVLSGVANAGCASSTGTFSLDSATGAITGVNCQ
jgi:prepilin-type N-terminal cleavage/methylation domain-containing protein